MPLITQEPYLRYQMNLVSYYVGSVTLVTVNEINTQKLLSFGLNIKLKIK